MKVVIDIKYEKTFTATSKAREDINTILSNLGYKIEYINVKKITNKADIIMNIFTCYKQLKKIVENIPVGSTLLFQYPFDWMSYKYSKLIKKLANKRNIKTVVLIHDLNSIRTTSKFGKLYYNMYINEYKFLDNFDKVICHNSKMKQCLLEKGIKDEKLIVLELFDYLVDDINVKRNKFYKKVIIAGNLAKEKAGYVYGINKLKFKNYKYNLYGVNYSGKSSDKVLYKGAFESSKPQECLKSGFGLVWDGSSYKECNGNFGRYLMWNNPHKLSLYMACGIPVIVWKKSALSEFVEKNKIGISINSLSELENFFSKLTLKDYEEYCKNVSKIQKKVINGKFLISAINKI